MKFRTQIAIVSLLPLLAMALPFAFSLRKADTVAAVANETHQDREPSVIPESSNAPTYVCRDMLETHENDLALALSEDTKVVDCMTVGCGGLF